MKIWVDTDMGFDDIWAVFVLLQAGAEIEGMSLVAGNSSLPSVMRNAAASAAAFDWQFPIYAGAAQALSGSNVTAARVLGPNGIRTRNRKLPEASEGRIQPGGASALGKWLESGSRGILLALGPLTNLAVLLQSRPELASRIGCVHWMGGGTGGGNHTQAAEFNAYSDPEALDLLLRCGVSLTISDLEACRTIRFGKEHLQRLARSCGSNAALLADLAGGYLDIALERSRSTMAIYDPVAAVLVTNPELFVLKDAQIEVVLAGDERGRTICKTPPAGEMGNARIVASLETDPVLRTCLDALDAQGARS